MYPTLQESYDAILILRRQLDQVDAMLDLVYAHPELAAQIPEGIAA
jgi:hypothetical protein